MSTKTITAIAAIGLALLPAACGSDDEGEPVPASLREQLESRLDEAERRLDDGSEGACSDVQDDTEPEVTRLLAELPEDVDADTRQTLEDGFSRLWELVSQECDRIAEETDTETTPAPEPAPIPEETPTETTPAPEPAPEEDEGDEGDGDGGGKGKGNGGDGGGDGGIEVPGTSGGGAIPPEDG